MIDQAEMFAVTSLLATGDTREKLKFLFAMYDENGKCCKGRFGQVQGRIIPIKNAREIKSCILCYVPYPL